MSTEQTIWGIHAGRTRDADWLFTKQNVIALGWAEFGDLVAYPSIVPLKRDNVPDREGE